MIKLIVVELMVMRIIDFFGLYLDLVRGDCWLGWVWRWRGFILDLIFNLEWVWGCCIKVYGIVMRLDDELWDLDVMVEERCMKFGIYIW